MPDYTVSVLIPTHNRRTELLRAIDSVMAQSRPPDQIIVVDDKSDFSVSSFLCERYGNAIRVISNEKNLGPAESRNIGARAAIGEYIAFLDSDDYWHPEKMQRQLAILEEKKDVGVVYCDQWVIGPDGNAMESFKELIDTQLWEHLLWGWTAPNPSTLIFNRSVFMRLGGFDSTLRSSEDHDLWMRMAKVHIAVAFSPERLSYFSWNSSSRITHDYQNRITGMEQFLEKWKDSIVESHGRKHYRQFKANYVSRVCFPLVKRAVRQRELSRALGIYGRYLALNAPSYKKIGARVMRDIKQLSTRSPPCM